MTSNDIANVADYVAGFVCRDEPIPVEAAGNLAKVLMDLASRVQQMELVPFRLHSPEVQLPFKQKRKSHDVY